MVKRGTCLAAVKAPQCLHAPHFCQALRCKSHLLLTFCSPLVRLEHLEEVAVIVPFVSPASTPCQRRAGCRRPLTSGYFAVLVLHTSCIHHAGVVVASHCDTARNPVHKHVMSLFVLQWNAAPDVPSLAVAKLQSGHPVAAVAIRSVCPQLPAVLVQQRHCAFIAWWHSGGCHQCCM